LAQRQHQLRSQRQPRRVEAYATVRGATMFRFVTIVPLELWAIILLLVFMWAAFGLNGFLITVLCVAFLQSGRWTVRR
jgi:hypothetical protein